MIVEIFSSINERYMQRHKNSTYTNTSTVPIWIGPLGLHLTYHYGSGVPLLFISWEIYS